MIFGAINPKTGMYWSGRAFDAVNREDAKPVPAGTTSADFNMIWACPVEIIVLSIDIAA